MIEIDGSGGGGQLLRSTLALSCITGEAVAIDGIRGERPEPGLGHQHRAAVRLAAAICDADVSETALGTESLTFEPAGIEPGAYRAEVATAGSVTLLFDTVLPLALATSGPITVTASGGTDVKWSPPMDYYRRVKLPLLRAWGLQASVDVAQRGFYPAGDGRATLAIAPSRPPSLDLTERGALESVGLYSLQSTDLSDQSVATRQADAATERLSEAGLEVSERVVRTVRTASTGSAVVVRSSYDAHTGFDALGERGRPAEAVGTAAAEDACRFHHETDAPIDRFMADQVLLLLAIRGGRIAIPALTEHVESSIELLAEFGVSIERPTPLALACPDPIANY